MIKEGIVDKKREKEEIVNKKREKEEIVDNKREKEEIVKNLGRMEGRNSANKNVQIKKRKN